MAVLRQFLQQVLADETRGTGEREQHADFVVASVCAIPLSGGLFKISLFSVSFHDPRSTFPSPLWLLDRSPPYRRGIPEQAGRVDRRDPKSRPDGPMQT